MPESFRIRGPFVAAIIGTLIGLLIAVPTADSPDRPAAMSEPTALLTVILDDGMLETSGPADVPLHDDIVALVKTLRSGRARANATSIEVAGVASAHGSWTAAIATFQDRLPAGVSLEADVIVVDDALEIDGLCARMFAKISDAHIEFRQSSSVLRSASHAALDRIVNFTRNCQRGILRITGHSDAVGGAEFNLGLSRRRAAAVAAYLQSGGVPAERLRVLGKGASEPVADNGTISGRARNRRIEFALLPRARP